MSVKELDTNSKIILIFLVVVIVYFLIFLLASPFFATGQTPMMNMMEEMMGTNFLNFSSTNPLILNLVSLSVAVAIGFFASLYLFAKQKEDKGYSILRRGLSEDEKRILDEIKKAGEITQDSLRFRLEWSKAKVSTLLTNLDKRELIQRERTGKTYKVYLQKTV